MGVAWNPVALSCCLRLSLAKTPKTTSKVHHACTPVALGKFRSEISPTLCDFLRVLRYEYYAGTAHIMSFFGKEMSCFLVLRCRAAQ